MTFEFYQKHYTLNDLLAAGVHFGHSTRRWNPKTAPFIFGVREGVHIIDLRKTVELLEAALKVLKETAARNGRILFVCTKKQSTKIVEKYAQKCGQSYINSRWLGGTLTNWMTVSGSFKTMKELKHMLANPRPELTKKELLRISRHYEKLEKSIGGIQSMGGLPDLIFVIDSHMHRTAVNEARVLGIPIVGVVDSNCDPAKVTYPIPGNDDGSRAIELYCSLAATAILSGLEDGLKKAGMDLGKSAEVSVAAQSAAKEQESEIVTAAAVS